MATVNTTAGKLKVGDAINLAGIEYVLVKITRVDRGFVSLEFNTTEVIDRRNTDMFIDCRPTVQFARILASEKVESE